MIALMTLRNIYYVKSKKYLMDYVSHTSCKTRIKIAQMGVSFTIKNKKWQYCAMFL